MPSIDSVITKGWKVAIKEHDRDFIIPAVEEICNRFGPIYFLWGPGREGTTGHHSQGRAMDVSILDKGSGPQSTWIDRPGPERRALGNEIANWLVQKENRDRLNINDDDSYIIWNRRIASKASNPAWTWRTYTGKNPHTDHLHISFDRSGVYRAPEQDWLMAGEAAQIIALVNGVSTLIKNHAELMKSYDAQNQRRYESILFNVQQEDARNDEEKARDAQDKIRDEELKKQQEEILKKIDELTAAHDENAPPA